MQMLLKKVRMKKRAGLDVLNYNIEEMPWRLSECK